MHSMHSPLNHNKDKICNAEVRKKRDQGKGSKVQAGRGGGQGGGKFTNALQLVTAFREEIVFNTVGWTTVDHQFVHAT